MKLSKLFFGFTFLFFTVHSQNFVWVKGTNLIDVPGVYGTPGVAAPANNPGARHGCAKWVDTAGNLWLFGGEGLDTGNVEVLLNDLWKYDIVTNEWTWIRGSNGPDALGSYGTPGVASPANEPGAREFMASWTDASGNFWMFGGDGFGSSPSFGRLNDLWKYNPLTNEWTWINGSTAINQSGTFGSMGTPAPGNIPGGRAKCGTWTDAAGNFWLFGGRGYASNTLQGRLNDLWKYDVVSNAWTWVNGSNLNNPVGSYGTLSVSSATTTLGGREYPACWIDNAGEVYVFGGFGRDSTIITPSISFLNDLWKYNSTTNQWTWIGGSAVTDVAGTYGTQGTPSALNIPGARVSTAHWRDALGKLWLFGGEGYPSANTPTVGLLNDVFVYDPVANTWTWLKGSNSADQGGTYGTQGIAAPANNPGARKFNTWWTDVNNGFWLFGGEGYDASAASEGNMNDLWTFRIACNPDSIVVNPTASICSGASVSLTAVGGASSGTVNWFDALNSSTAVATGSTYILSSATVSAPTVYSFYAEISSCPLPRTVVHITVNPLPEVSISTSQATICASNSTSLFASGALNYAWSTVPAATGSFVSVSPAATTIYTLTGSNVYNCQNTDTLLIEVFPCTGISEAPEQGILRHQLYPVPNKGVFTLSLEEATSGMRFTLTNTLGQVVYTQTLEEQQTVLKTGLPAGVYFYKIELSTHQKAEGKILIE